MRIAILGGTRFIGRHIADRLVADGHDLLLVHRGEHEPGELPAAEHAHVDRHDAAALSAAVKPFGAEAVVDVSAMNAVAADAALAASYRLFADQIIAAAGRGAELVTVPDDLLPDDLRITRAIGQHLLMDAAKARDVLGWTESDPPATLLRSVRWHLENPDPDQADDWSADDRALASRRTPA